MARKVHPAIGCGWILMLVGFIVLMVLDLITGIGILIVGFIVMVIGVILGLIGIATGANDQDGPSQIIITGDKSAHKELEDDDGYNPDVPAWLRDPKPKSPKPKKPQPKKKPPGKKS